MRTIETIVYHFDELTADAQAKAVTNLQDINVDYYWWDSIYEDAERIGLKLTGFDLDRNRHATGDLITSALEVAETIMAEHGKDTETYQLANEYADKLRRTLDDDLPDLEDEFTGELLDAYSFLLQNEHDYLTTDEAVIDTIQANDYEFTADGKLI